MDFVPYLPFFEGKYHFFSEKNKLPVLNYFNHSLKNLIFVEPWICQGLKVFLISVLYE